MLPVCRCQGTGQSVDSDQLIVDSSFEMNCRASAAADAGPQRLGFVLALLRNQRNASAASHSGDISVVVPPVPIPNTEVKRCSPDGSTAIGRARVGRRQNKNPGELIIGVFAFGDDCSSTAEGRRESSRGNEPDRREARRVSERERTNQ